MSTSSEFVDLTNFTDIAEDVIAESADYVNFPLLAVGIYESPSRTVTAREKDSNLTFKITFDSGLWKDGKKVVASETTYASTKPFVRDGYPGSTSTAAEYLRKVGIDPKSGSIVELMAESQTIPVGVFIGRTNKTAKLEDGTYEKEILKTRDFNVGSKENPEYVTEVTVGGQHFNAKHKVQSFQKLVA